MDVNEISKIYPKVADIIADVLAINASDIKPDSSLMSDLGAESIDFLDLIFRLEKGFGIKIPRGQIEKEARGTLADDEFEKDGVITSQGMQVLKQYLSEVPPERFKESMKVNEIPSLFTTNTLCKLVLKAQKKHQETEASA